MSTQSLVISEIVSKHNHPTHPVLFDHYPENRRLDCAEKAYTKELIDYQVKPAILQDVLRRASNTKITPKDLSNIR